MNFSITRRGEYGVTAALFLAQREPGSLSQIHEIAEHCGLPEPFLAQILRLLGRAGIVVSKKGAHGGFALTRSADEISFLEVLEALEGPVAVNRCQSSVHACDEQGICSMEAVWTKAQQALIDVLHDAKLSEAVEPGRFPVLSVADVKGVPAETVE